MLINCYKEYNRTQMTQMILISDKVLGSDEKKIQVHSLIYLFTYSSIHRHRIQNRRTRFVGKIVSDMLSLKSQ